MRTASRVQTTRATKGIMSSLPSSDTRLVTIDIMRGFAVLLMVIFHFCYDLNYFNLARFDFYHSSFWTGFRSIIVTLFLLVSGVSLVLANRTRINRTRFLRRVGILSAAAIMITITSYFMFPGRTIIIGILHFIAIASLLALPFLHLYFSNLLAGILVIFLGQFLSLSAFDNPWIHWIGFVTHKPPTEDYVPIFPWFGVILIGIYLGQAIIRNSGLQRRLSRFPNRAISSPLSFAGRHSLAIYLLHQPVLMGLLFLATR